MKVCLRHDFKPHISYGFYCSIIMPRASFFERCCAPRSTNIIHYSFFFILFQKAHPGPENALRP